MKKKNRSERKKADTKTSGNKETIYGSNENKCVVMVYKAPGACH